MYDKKQSAVQMCTIKIKDDNDFMCMYDKKQFAIQMCTIKIKDDNVYV